MENELKQNVTFVQDGEGRLVLVQDGEVVRAIPLFDERKAAAVERTEKLLTELKQASDLSGLSKATFGYVSDTDAASLPDAVEIAKNVGLSREEILDVVEAKMSDLRM